METRLIQLGILPPRPTIWDVGAYQGQWAKEMILEYPDASVRLFEPVPTFAEALTREGGLDISACGLSDREEVCTLTVAGDRSSTYEMGHNGTPVTVHLRDIVQELGDTKVDVMKINVEGAEYPILERLLATDKLKQINTFLIQFHTFIPNFGERYLDIKKGMLKTHTLTWRTPFVWERWDLTSST